MTINQLIYEMLNNDTSSKENNLNKKFNKIDVNINSPLSPNYKTAPLMAKKVEFRSDKLHGITGRAANKI